MIFSELPLDLGLSDLWRLLGSIRRREGLTRGEMMELKQVFITHKTESPDVRGVDEIVILRAGRAIREFGFVMHYHLLQKLASEVDIDGSGKLNFAEFLKLARKFREKEIEDAMSAFRAADPLEGEGVLDVETLLELFRDLGCVDQKGKPPMLTPDECNGVHVYHFLGIYERFKTATRQYLRKDQGFGAYELAGLRQMFSKYDVNHSGDVSRSELVTLIQEILPAYAHSAEKRPQLQRIINEVDSDKSGTLDFSDFLKLMRKVYDEEDEERFAKEQAVIQEVRFTPSEVRDFRDLYLAQDEDDSGTLDFEEIESMVRHIVPLGDKNRGKLMTFYRAVTSKSKSGHADFAGFLRIMRRVFDDTELMKTCKATMPGGGAWPPPPSTPAPH